MPYRYLCLLAIACSMIMSFSLNAQKEDPTENSKEQSDGLDFIIPYTGSGIAMSTGRYNYWIEYIDEHRQVKEKKNKLEQTIHFKKTHTKDEVYQFEIVFHNLSKLPKQEFDKQVAFQLEALNRDFGSEAILHEPSLYDKLIEAPNFRFSPSASGTIYAPRAISWAHWNGVKNEEISSGSPPINPDRVINIWVIDIPNEVGSYAQSPEGPPETDGIVIDVDFFGYGHDRYTQGKTLTYLMGNFFGLLPLSGSTKCAEDLVFDTPLHHQTMRDCIDTRILSSCDGRPLMTMNFMSLAPDDCKYMFTKGQVNRMVHIIKHAENRRSLLSNKNLVK